MPVWDTLVLAVGLSMDACAVSLAASASQRARGARATFRLSFHFGLFQCLMPIAGWFLGSGVAPCVGSVDYWIAFALLTVVGGRMVHTGWRGGTPDSGVRSTDPSRGLTLIVLSVATSVDALAVGLSLAMLRTNIWYPSVIIGLVTGGLSLVALRVGNRLGASAGRRMEVAGGILLIAIGVRALAGHVL